MHFFLVALHVFLSASLVGIILLQPGKGADAASAFGGGMGAGMFGPRGQANALSRVTAVIAVLFMVTSISLALYSDRRSMSGADDVENALEKIQKEQAQPDAGGSGAVEPSAAPSDEATAIPPEGAPADAGAAGVSEPAAGEAAPTAPANP